MKTTQRLLKIISNLVLALVICIGILVVLSFSRIPGGFKMFTVMSGSMEPTLHTGSVIFAKPMTHYAVGDVVTRTTTDPKVTITHRIASFTGTENQAMFQTKGDANNAADGETFPQSAIIGKEFLTIPFLGYVVAFAKTQAGVMLLIIIPAVIIIYEELGKIIQEVRSIRQRKLDEKGKITIIEERTNPEKYIS